MSRADTQWAGDVSRYLAGLGNQEDGWRLIEMAGKITRLEREAAELRAHVERLREDLLKQTGMVWSEFSCGESEEDFLHDTCYYETPRQSLAAVRAEAVESLRFPRTLRKMWTGGEVQQWLKDQAQQLRRETDDE